MKRKHLWWAVAGVGGAAAVVAVLWGPIASQVERARYKVVERKRAFEIRDYTPMIVAETEVSGSREEAIRQGFRTLADYIFGNNAAMRVVAMTAPVTQQAGGAGWTVRFVMPARYTLDTLPEPNNAAISLKHLEGKRVAAICFSGRARDASVLRQAQRLERFIREKGLHPLSSPALAIYNPPWTVPFLRRNEVMIEIARQ